MKKILYSMMIIAFAFSSCSKQEDGASNLEQPPDNSDVLVVPSNFSRKVLIEEFTGAWCGYCPIGTYMFDSLSTQVYPGRLLQVAIHVSVGPPGSEVMECPQLFTSNGNRLQEFFDATGVPTGAVDRDTLSHPVYWPSVVPEKLARYSPCGFSIDATKVNGNSLTVTVHTGFSSNLFGDYRLNVWVTEDNVHNATNTDYNQINYYSGNGGSSPDPSLPYYYYDPSIIDFHHQNVLRKLVTAVPFGDQVPQDMMVKGKDYIRTFTVDLSGMDKSNTYVVAFLDKYSPVPTTDHDYPQHQVQNAQRVKVGSNSGWN